MVILGVVLGTALTVAVITVIGPSTRTATAQLTSAVGLYPGSSVRILGVSIGKIDSITVHPGEVDVRFSYEAKYRIPADAFAVVLAPALVPDRFIQLAPAYQSGPVMADNAVIPESRTAVPMEIDQITTQVNQLAQALGPQALDGGQPGHDGPLSKVVDAAAANLDGNGAALGATIANRSKAASTVASSSPDLFATIRNLKVFVAALVANDTQVRSANAMLAAVLENLAAERPVITTALENLTAALSSVSGFLSRNKAVIGTSITSITSITSTLLAQKQALSEILTRAPAAVTNVVNAVDPATSSLRARLQLGTLTTSEADVCAALSSGNLMYVANASTRAQCQSATPLIPGVTG